MNFPHNRDERMVGVLDRGGQTYDDRRRKYVYKENANHFGYQGHGYGMSGMNMRSEHGHGRRSQSDRRVRFADWDDEPQYGHNLIGNYDPQYDAECFCDKQDDYSWGHMGMLNGGGFADIWR